jgi:hypothetical protein
MVERLSEAYQTLSEPEDIREALLETLNGLLPNDSDEGLRTALIAQADRFLSNASYEHSERCGFCLQVVRLVLNERPGISGFELSVHGRLVSDLEAIDALPWHMRPLTPTSIEAPPPPQAETAGDFRFLLPAAIERRIRATLGFFHRRNPAIIRELAPPQFLQPSFCDKTVEAVKGIIIPTMLGSRRISVIANSRRWDQVDTVEFWKILENEKQTPAILDPWHDAWKRASLEGDAKTFSAMKKFLGRDDASFLYGNDETALLASLLDPTFSRFDLENAWNKTRQLYEQELDRRVYQDKAREGALRDGLLSLLDRMPDRQGELTVLLCYWNFPRLTLRFLASFSRNKGATEAERRRRVPFLMRFLDDPAISSLMKVEDRRHAEERDKKEGMRGLSASAAQNVAAFR